MKKLLLVISCVFTVLTAFAESKVYNEQLVVTINGESSAPQTTGVTVVDNGNGTINFELKNFFLSDGQNDIPIGNIVMENLAVTQGEDGLGHIAFDGSITIQDGDMAGVDTWMGPMVGEIPMKLQGKLNESKLYVTIDIDMKESLGQIVYVQLGTDDFNTKSKVYNEQLVVTINGESSAPQMTGVTVVDNGNGTINFELKNFFLSDGQNNIPVGNIVMENLAVTQGEDGLGHIAFDGSITIQDGDMAGVDTWMGPMIGEIPMKLQGKLNESKLYVTIDIDMQSTLGQIVYVQLGTDDFKDDSGDAIHTVPAAAASSSVVYDLNGRRVNAQLKKGLYIVGGKKVLF